MNDKLFPSLLLVLLGVLGLGVIVEGYAGCVPWPLISGGLLALVISVFFWRFERQPVSAKELSLFATLAALAAASRVPFALIPGLQPVTFLVMISGWVFGLNAGFMIGALAALVSNFFLGHGPWTPWQMLAWGLSGACAALAAGKTKPFSRVTFTLLAVAWGYIFGWVMNLWHWLAFIYPLNLKTFLAVYLASFPMDTLHALGNLIFSLVFGSTISRILVRFKKKITLEDTSQ